MHWLWVKVTCWSKSKASACLAGVIIAYVKPFFYTLQLAHHVAVALARFISVLHIKLHKRPLSKALPFAVLAASAWIFNLIAYTCHHTFIGKWQTKPVFDPKIGQVSFLAEPVNYEASIVYWTAYEVGGIVLSLAIYVAAFGVLRYHMLKSRVTPSHEQGQHIDDAASFRKMERNIFILCFVNVSIAGMSIVLFSSTMLFHQRYPFVAKQLRARYPCAAFGSSTRVFIKHNPFARARGATSSCRDRNYEQTVKWSNFNEVIRICQTYHAKMKTDPAVTDTYPAFRCQLHHVALCGHFLPGERPGQLGGRQCACIHAHQRVA